MQEREAFSEQQRVKPMQQGKKCEEECDVYGDNRRDKVRLNKVTEEVSNIGVKGKGKVPHWGTSAPQPYFVLSPRRSSFIHL
jgi:hypothetical protein